MIRRLIRRVPYFCFSSELAQANRPSLIGKLSESLLSEIQQQKQQFKLSGSADMLKASGFEFKDSPGNSLMRLEKELEECAIELRYQVNRNEEENKEGETIVSFALIIKFKDGSGLLVDCFGVNGELEVHKARYYRNISRAIDVGGMADMVEMSKEYPGPDFRSLDAAVRESFTSYVVSLGVEKNLLNFIEKSTKDKGRLLYIIWLEKIREISNAYKEYGSGIEYGDIK